MLRNLLQEVPFVEAQSQQSWLKILWNYAIMKRDVTRTKLQVNKDIANCPNLLEIEQWLLVEALLYFAASFNSLMTHSESLSPYTCTSTPVGMTEAPPDT